MEVKIKGSTGMIDATIEIVDGVMVVSPKEVKFEPKDGDVVACENYDCLELFIFKERTDEIECTCHCYYCEKDNCLCVDNDEYIVTRYATEEEKNKLFNKLAEEGYEWKAETKELVKLKWKPKCNDNYWSPSLFDSKFMPWKNFWSDSEIGNKRLEKGWVFRTEEECQELCNRLNDAINSVKP